ncbi:MAG: carbohydrate binding domain-containing protein [Nitrospirae bacterium]|nr:carbohydrate binding domain-containing protein [Nitrospirota bacterium]
MSDIKKLFLVLLISSLIYCLILGGFGTLYAANFQWIQTDWSGGASPSSTTGHNPAQNGQTSWNQYYSKDPNIEALSTNGQLTLSPLSASWIQDTDTDFNSGTLTSLQIMGTGSAAYLTLNDYVPALGTGADGDLIVDGTTASSSSDLQVHGAGNPLIINGIKNYNKVFVQNGGVISGSPASLLSPPASINFNSLYGYTAPPGDNYYIVTTVDQFGNETQRSPLTDNPYGNRIIGLRGWAPYITWSPVAGAAGYRVYRRTEYVSTDYSSPALVCSITNPATTSCLDTLPAPQPGSPHLKLTPALATPGVSPTGGNLTDGTYYYVATAIDFWGFETNPGTQRTVTISTGTNTASVSLSWSAISEASGYRVYRSSTSGIYNINDPNSGMVCQTTSLSCTDTLSTPIPGAPSMSYDNAAANGMLQLKIIGTLSVDSTSSINLDGMGFSGGVNTTTSTQGVPGKGPGAAGNRGGGGGYGSAGTSNSNPLFPSATGIPYGSTVSVAQSPYPGSGGASGSFSSLIYQGGTGGNGGGTVRISANDISLAGTISAKGSPGQNANQNLTDPGGAGSGGLVFLDSNILNSTGQITAIGGSGGVFIPSSGKNPSNYATAGSGGNGRIRLSALSAIPGTTNPAAFVGNAGLYESPSQDLGAGGVRFTNHNISWTGQLNGGNIKFLIATNKDNQTWIFCGPGGVMESSVSPAYYTPDPFSVGTPIWDGHNGDRYIRYKIIFEAPDIDPLNSPVLDNVTIGYEYNPFFQSLVSSPYDTGNTANPIRALTWDANLAPGTDASLQLRTGGSSAGVLATDWYGPINSALANSGVIVANPGFESCTGSYTIPPGWTASTVPIDDGCYNSGYTGSWSLSERRTQDYFSQSLQLSSGVTYTFGVWARSAQAAQQTAILLVSSTAGGGSTYCTNQTNSTSWTLLSCQYTPSTNQTIYLNLRSTGTKGYYAWFDDVSVSVLSTSGLSTIAVQDVSGFSVGDWVTITESTNPSQVELKKISAIDTATNRITLNSPLLYGYTTDSVVTNTFTDPQGTKPVNILNRDGVNDQWLQYRVLLTAEDRLQTPVFLENRIGYLPAAGIYQPDGVIDSNGDCLLTFDECRLNGSLGTFGSGGGGISNRSVDPGFKNGLATYTVQIQNDGNPASGMDSISINWNTPSDASGAWTVVLNDISQNLSSPVTVTLDPGSSQTYTLEVTPSIYAPADSVKTVTLDIHSQNEYVKGDSIQAVTTINRAYQTDGIIETNGNDTRDTTGNGNGGSASKTSMPADTMTYTITIENEGNIQDVYILSQTSSCTDSNNLAQPLPPNWKILINDGTTDYDLVSATWTTTAVPAKINAGSVVQYTLKVFTSGEPMTCTTILKIDSIGTGTTQDSLTATTVLSNAYGVDLWIEGTNGDNLYDATGTGGGGNYSKGILGGVAGTFDIKVQNEGNGPDSFILEWSFDPPIPPDWSITILNQDGSTLCASPSSCIVPPSDLACIYKSGSQCLAIAGEVIPLRLQVSPPSSFTSGYQDIIIKGTSMGDTSKVDSIRARVWANSLTITVASVTPTSSTITWPAPPWPADSYDLRYSRGDINSAKEIIEDGLIPVPNQVNFSNATAVRGLPKPKTSGTESFTVTQLYANTNYYFALKTRQNGGNTSVISSCSNCPRKTDSSSDLTPPSAVSDLVVTSGTADSETLCWTAPYDDNPSTPVTGYVLKYSTKKIVDGITPGMGEVLFSNATTIDDLGIPKSPGTQECYKVKVNNIISQNDRTPNTQFFFALKSGDENQAGNDGILNTQDDNLSSISNVAQGLTAMSSNAYNMVSVPKVPNPNSPADVFGDDVGSPLYLYWWDSRGVGHDQGCYDGLPNQFNPNNVNPPCTQITAIQEGKGYFLWSPRQDVVLDAPVGSSEVTPASCTNELNQSFNCYVYTLKEGWNTIGNPFGKEVDVSAVRIRETKQQELTTTITTAPFLQAVNNNWIGNAIYSYNGTAYSYDICDNTGCNPVLQSWKSYWVWLYSQGGAGEITTYYLLIPMP